MTLDPLRSASAILVANRVAQIPFGLLAMAICLPSMKKWGAIFHAGQASVQPTFSAFLAGAAAAGAGPMQQPMDAAAGYAVGPLPLGGSLHPGWLVPGCTLCAIGAQVVLHRRPAVATP